MSAVVGFVKHAWRFLNTDPGLVPEPDPWLRSLVYGLLLPFYGPQVVLLAWFLAVLLLIRSSATCYPGSLLPASRVAHAGRGPMKSGSPAILWASSARTSSTLSSHR